MIVFEHDGSRQNERVGSRGFCARRGGAERWRRVGGDGSADRHAGGGGVPAGVERSEVIPQGLVLLLELLDQNLHLFHEDALAIASALGVHAVALAADLVELGGRALGPVLAEEVVVDSVVGEVALGVDGGMARLGGCCHGIATLVAAHGRNDACRCCLANLLGTVLAGQDEGGQLGDLGGVRDVLHAALHQGIDLGIDGRRGGIVGCCRLAKHAQENAGRVLLVDGLPKTELVVLELGTPILKDGHVLLLALPRLAGVHSIPLAAFEGGFEVADVRHGWRLGRVRDDMYRGE